MKRKVDENDLLLTLTTSEDGEGDLHVGGLALLPLAMVWHYGQDLVLSDQNKL